jgi:P2 family phage contractile tail tube protein
MANNFPNILLSYNIYANGSNKGLSGVVDVTLPNIQFMVDSFKSAGYAGVTDLPVVGMVQAMHATITFTSVWDDALVLLAPTGQDLILRAGVQSMASDTNQLVPTPERVSMKIFPLGKNLGRAETGVQMGNTYECSVRYLAYYFNNIEKLQIDQPGMAFVVNGTDYLAPLRAMI